jgi:beta-phosphoglucomutase
MGQEKNRKKNSEFKIKVDTVLFFDMDGTLIDTNLANFLSYKKAINSVTKSDNNLTFNPDKRFNRSNLKIAIPNLTNIQYERIILEKEEYYDDFLNETKQINEVVNILIKYSKSHKTVLVTNCREDRAIKTLNHFGMLDKFSYKFFRQLGDNYEKTNKYQYAISQLGIQPSLIIAFENEECEIADARKAGISIINPTYI